MTMDLLPFKEINIDDPFFDSLKSDYKEFKSWFSKKSESNAYVSYDDAGSIQAVLYLKVEDGAVTDVAPNLSKLKWLKVGTFKVNPHGTRLGERFIKKYLI